MQPWLQIQDIDAKEQVGGPTLHNFSRRSPTALYRLELKNNSAKCAVAASRSNCSCSSILPGPFIVFARNRHDNQIRSKLLTNSNPLWSASATPSSSGARPPTNPSTMIPTATSPKGHANRASPGSNTPSFFSSESLCYGHGKQFPFLPNSSLSILTTGCISGTCSSPPRPTSSTASAPRTPSSPPSLRP